MTDTTYTPQPANMPPLWTIALMHLGLISADGVIKKHFADEVKAQEERKQALAGQRLAGFKGQDNHQFPGEAQ